MILAAETRRRRVLPGTAVPTGRTGLHTRHSVNHARGNAANRSCRPLIVLIVHVGDGDCHELCGGLFGYVGQVHIAWVPMALVAAGTIPGVATGTYAMQFISQDALRRAFAVFLFGLAAYMLYRTVPAVL